MATNLARRCLAFRGMPPEDTAAICQRISQGVAWGQLVPLPIALAPHALHLRLSPLFVLWKKGKAQVIHNLKKAGLLPDPGLGPDLSVKQLTNREAVLLATRAGFLTRSPSRCTVCSCRTRRPRCLGASIDIADAFKQVLMDLGLPLFSFFVGGGYLFTVLRLVFGWTASPGFFNDPTRAVLALLKSLRPSDLPEERRAQLGAAWGGTLDRGPSHSCQARSPTRPDGTVRAILRRS